MPMPEIHLYNTLSKKKEVFVPKTHGLLSALGGLGIGIGKKTVTMYHCGPTVYLPSHIGHARPYVFADVLRRTFEYNGYSVRQVINITDVGHLVGDGDEGEDKMQLTAQKEGRTSHEIADFYTKAFRDELTALNVETNGTQFPRATSYIKEQLALISALEKKGLTYVTSDGVYFDTAKFPAYGKLGNVDLAGLEEGKRVAVNSEKRNATDFALWKFSPKPKSDATATLKRDQEWPSPWGVGFPGWHIECSAMSMKLLGNILDIHTGGIDHIPTHHNNEIAQSEGVTGKPFVRYWLHSAHILLDGQKISKSLGNTIYLKDFDAYGVNPLAYRYWLLTASYHTQMNFTWEAVAGAQTAYDRLVKHVAKLGGSADDGKVSEKYGALFLEAINDDLNTPKAIATMWDMLGDASVSDADKRATALKFDTVLGLKLDEMPLEKEVSAEIQAFIDERNRARAEKNWKKADEIRDTLTAKGYSVVDKT